MDGLFRAGYWAAYRLLCGWWFVRRSTHSGASVAVWHDGKLLVVQHSYQRGLFLPGGGIHRGEEPLAAAQRELREEVGLSVRSSDLRPPQISVTKVAFRNDTTHIFELYLNQAPDLRIDRREITDARFMAPAALVGAQVSAHLAHYLRRAPHV